MVRSVKLRQMGACLAALFIAGDGHAQESVELPGEDRTLALELSEVYRIGSAGAGADWELLHTVQGAGFDEAGNLYFLNSPHRVVAVDPAGNLLRQFGRTGGGPGEFGNPRQLDVLPDGRSNRGPNHGKRSRKFNQGCTICVCRCYTGPCWTLPRER